MQATYLDLDSIIDGFSKSEKLNSFMTGILLFDTRNNTSQEYIVSLLSDFDTESGEYIDFYLPVFVKKSQKSKYESEWTDDYKIELRKEVFYFQPSLFESELLKYKNRFNFKFREIFNLLNRK